MRTIESLIALAFVVILLAPADGIAARQKNCVTAEGKVKIKRRCRSAKGETELSLELLAGAAQGPQGPIGPQGAAGPQGPKGDSGPKGEPGLAQFEIISNPRSLLFKAGTGFFITTNPCPSTKKLIGGACINDHPSISLDSSGPVPDRLRWECAFRNKTGSDVTFVVTAESYCAVVSE